MISDANFIGMSVTLSGVELLRVSTVLQDCADQLSVLGQIMPDIYRSRQVAALCKVLSDENGDVTKKQNGEEQNLKAAGQGQGVGGLSDATRELHMSQKELNRTLDANPHSSNNLAKVQQDRQSVAQVINDALVEVQEKGTFNSLLLAVEQEKRKKAYKLDIVIS
ncbi:hypothetical protein UPYG_G00206320 [Umbra pygmaea]|uniref:Uncharacterized protein n=1 Tax=Umbra pygmaea TaxID=75934 RepID=A0ABD0X386_UMBPY